jgi:hypothetical protein
MTATIGTDCGCGGGSSADAASAPTSGGERTRYFPRQLVAAADLTQDQIYFREKSRRHNRLLHGWGIVCGVEVRASKAPGSVDVNAGYVLGPLGDEIVVDEMVTVDLTRQNLDGDALNGCVPADPWCADVKVARPSGKPFYLAIGYAEYACRPVATTTSGCGCGCEEGACEYSRWRDSYRIRVLDELPDPYRAVAGPPAPLSALGCGPGRSPQVPGEHAAAPAPCTCPRCSPCPTSPWVVLADLTVNGDEITVDCDAHRRYVGSFRDFYYMCGPHAFAVPGPYDDLRERGVALTADDELAARFLEQMPDDDSKRGFLIGLGAAEGQTEDGPGKQAIHDALPAVQQMPFNLAVEYSLARNRTLDMAVRGAGVMRADPDVADAARAKPSVFYALGFEVSTGLFGDPAFGAKGNTATGPGAFKIRAELRNTDAIEGFNAAVKFHLGPPLRPRQG